MRLFNHRLADDGAVLQHIFQIDKIAVVFFLGEIVSIVEMDNAFIMGFHDIFGKKKTFRQILGNLACHVVSLGGVDNRVLIGIFLLDLFIIEFNER